MTLRVEEITREQHLAFVAGRGSASHMQVPSWGEVESQAWSPWETERDGPRTLIETSDSHQALIALLAVQLPS